MANTRMCTSRKERWVHLPVCLSIRIQHAHKGEKTLSSPSLCLYGRQMQWARLASSGHHLRRLSVWGEGAQSGGVQSQLMWANVWIAQSSWDCELSMMSVSWSKCSYFLHICRCFCYQLEFHTRHKDKPTLWGWWWRGGGCRPRQTV